MDRQYIDQHNVIERYLLNTLTEEEAAEFEDTFALDAELQQEIDSAEVLIAGLRAHANQKKTPKNSPAHINLKKSSEKSWLPLSLAANVFLGLGGGYLLLNGSSSGVGVDVPLSIVNPPSIVFEHVRSAESNRPVFKQTDEWVSLRVSGAVFSGKPEKLEVLRGDGTSIITEDNINFGGFSQWIDWTIHGSKLPPGLYELKIHSLLPDNERSASSVPFLVCEGEVGEDGSCTE